MNKQKKQAFESVGAEELLVWQKRSLEILTELLLEAQKILPPDYQDMIKSQLDSIAFSAPELAGLRWHKAGEMLRDMSHSIGEEKGAELFAVWMRFMPILDREFLASKGCSSYRECSDIH